MGQPPPDPGSASFLSSLLDIERGWARLEEAGRLATTDPRAAGAAIAKAVTERERSAPLLVAAADLLTTLGETARAHVLLEQAVAFDAPPAPAQIALGRSFRACGDLANARRWLRGGMLRARPDAALLLELAAIEPGDAFALTDAARGFPCRQPELAATAGQALRAAGEARPARIAFDIAYGAGARDPNFLIAYSDLLAEPALHDDPPLPDGPIGMPHWWVVATHAAQARLARAYPVALLIAEARAREDSDRWIGNDRLASYLADRIRSAAPFSWIRLGDGEARFLMHVRPALRTALPAHEAEATARQIWFAWFGQNLDSVPPGALESLAAQFDAAIRNADLLGVTSGERLTYDRAHQGFCAALEHYIQPILADRPGTLLCDATAHIALNEADPFLASLLSGLDFVGVVAPHPDLAERLRRHLSIGTVRHYDIPGESRLDRPRDHADRGAHFPDTFARIMADLTVPHPGAVFLVAGGLLGKIYCDRIKALGGIALDIGAIADAWMGHNTRGTVLAKSTRQPLPS